MSFLSRRRRRRRRQWIRSRLNRYKCVWGYMYVCAPYIELLYLCLVATRPLDADADAYWGRVPVCLKTFPSIVIKYIEYTTNTLSQVVSTIVYSLYSQGVVQLVSLTFPVRPPPPSFGYQVLF